jgi:hypothetical protein
MTDTDLTLCDFDHATLAADVAVTAMKVDAHVLTTPSRELRRTSDG